MHEAQLVEGPSKVPEWCNSTDMGLNPLAGQGGRKILAAPSVADISVLFAISSERLFNK